MITQNLNNINILNTINKKLGGYNSDITSSGLVRIDESRPNVKRFKSCLYGCKFGCLAKKFCNLLKDLSENEYLKKNPNKMIIDKDERYYIFDKHGKPEPYPTVDITELEVIYNKFINMTNRCSEALSETVNFIANDHLLSPLNLPLYKLFAYIVIPVEELFDLIDAMRNNMDKMSEYIEKVHSAIQNFKIVKPQDYKPIIDDILDGVLNYDEAIDKLNAGMSGGHLDETEQKVKNIIKKLDLLKNMFSSSSNVFDIKRLGFDTESKKGFREELEQENNVDGKSYDLHFFDLEMNPLSIPDETFKNAKKNIDYTLPNIQLESENFTMDTNQLQNHSVLMGETFDIITKRINELLQEKTMLERMLKPVYTHNDFTFLDKNIGELQNLLSQHITKLDNDSEILNVLMSCDISGTNPDMVNHEQFINARTNLITEINTAKSLKIPNTEIFQFENVEYVTSPTLMDTTLGKMETTYNNVEAINEIVGIVTDIREYVKGKKIPKVDNNALNVKYKYGYLSDIADKDVSVYNKLITNIGKNKQYGNKVLADILSAKDYIMSLVTTNTEKQKITEIINRIPTIKIMNSLHTIIQPYVENTKNFKSTKLYKDIELLESKFGIAVDLINLTNDIAAKRKEYNQHKLTESYNVALLQSQLTNTEKVNKKLVNDALGNLYTQHDNLNELILNGNAQFGGTIINNLSDVENEIGSVKSIGDTLGSLIQNLAKSSNTLKRQASEYETLKINVKEMIKSCGQFIDFTRMVLEKVNSDQFIPNNTISATELEIIKNKISDINNPDLIFVIKRLSHVIFLIKESLNTASIDNKKEMFVALDQSKKSFMDVLLLFYIFRFF